MLINSEEEFVRMVIYFGNMSKIGMFKVSMSKDKIQELDGDGQSIIMPEKC